MESTKFPNPTKLFISILTYRNFVRKVYMCPIDDGVIKYDRSQFELSNALMADEFSELEKWRDTLYKLKLIGEYLPEKIGYGNLSQRKEYLFLHKTENPQFIITGTQTGGLPTLFGNHYTRVLDFDLAKNLVKVKGPLEASSEALTHAAVYEGNTSINVVFHIHSTAIWKGMIKENYPATAKEIPYGTLDMAQAVQNIVKNNDTGLIVMKGHDDGVISFAPDMDTAGKLLLEVYDKFGG